MDASGITIGGCRLQRVIGRGGMGTVYRAVQLGVERPVAVKLVPLEGADEQAVARFRREARVAGRIEHPNSLPIYAAGEEGGLLYIVMRLVEGPDLRALIEASGGLAPERAVRIVEQVAGALDAAHTAGLVHRDLKPANVLIDAGDHAWLSDFGLMRRVHDPDPVTRADQRVGTPRFAAPEQFAGAEPDAGVDVYALAGLLDAALPHGSARPRELAAVIAHGLAEDPADRPESAGELAREARAALTAEPTTSLTAVLPAPPVPPPVIPAPRRGAARTPSTAPRASTPASAASAPRRRRAPLAIAALALLIAGAVVVVVLATSGGGGTPAYVRDVTPAFSFEYPAGWRLIHTEQSHGSFRETMTRSPNGEATLLIDRTPDSSIGPSAQAHELEPQTAQTPGYRTIHFAAQQISDAPGFRWTFHLSGHPGSFRTDVLISSGGSLYAVLGVSTVERQSVQLAVHAAESIQPT